RKTLRLHQRLAPSIGTRIEVRLLLRLAVIRRDDLLGAFRHHMNRAPSEILHLFGMPVGPAGIGAIRLVPRVRSGDRKSALQIALELLIVDRARESAVALSEQAPV